MLNSSDDKELRVVLLMLTSALLRAGDQARAVAGYNAPADYAAKADELLEAAIAHVEKNSTPGGNAV